MSQNSTVLPTTGQISGLAMTQAVNNALDTIASHESGPGDPGAIGAYRFWADTTSNLLKIRNATNVGWDTIGPLNDLGIQSGIQVTAIASGTADAITASFTPAITAFSAGPVWWRATAANATTTPTFKRDGLAAKTLVKGAGLSLAIGDIPGAGAWMCSQYDATLDKEVLLNPANGVIPKTNPNLLVNPNFDVWQMGLSFSSSGYTADQWYFVSGGTCTASRIANPMPGAAYGATWTAGAASSFGQFWQAIEAAMVERYRGQTVTFSVYAAVNATFTGTAQLQCFYSNVSDAYSSQSTAVGSVVTITPNASFVRYQITITVPTDAVGIKFGLFPSSAQASGAAMSIAQTKLEVGTIATDFVCGSLQEIIGDCERFLEKSYSMTDAPASTTGYGRETHVATNPNDFYTFGRVKLRTRKRAIPSISTWNPTTGTASQFHGETDSSNSAPISVSYQSETGFRVACTGTPQLTTGYVYAFQFIADARL